MHAPELAGNTSMITSIRQAIAAGVPTVAECAGLLYLCRTVDGVPMVGALDADAAMSPRLTLGYRTAVADHDHLLGATGRRVTGHEFHRTTVTPAAGHRPGWLLEGVPDGFSLDPADTGTPDAARVLPAHPLGRTPDPGGAFRRRHPRVRADAGRPDFWSSSTN